jgi:hypothetical protein
MNASSKLQTKSDTTKQETASNSITVLIDNYEQNDESQNIPIINNGKIQTPFQEKENNSAIYGPQVSLNSLIVRQ